ncbi:MAG: aryl-sulfate sulfotransferase [Lachnospirales bacterium]
MKKIIAVLLITLLWGVTVYGEADYTLDIYNFEVLDQLATTKQTLSYDGELIENKFENRPSKGNDFLVIDIELNKKNGTEYINLNDIKLVNKDKIYSRQDSSILANHNYPPFTTSTVSFGDYTGNLIFEIPKGTNTKDLYLQLNNKKKNINSVTISNNGLDFIGSTNISVYKNLIDEQKEIEENLISEFNKGNYTLSNPFIALDPYNVAPLSSLVMFKSEKPAKASFIVKGKDEYTDIGYDMNTYETIHQLPISGLYGEYNNEVVIKLAFEDGTVKENKINIQTAPMKDIFNGYEPVVHKNNKSEMENGLIFLDLSVAPLIGIDGNGEIRWQMNNKESGSKMTRFKNGHFISKNSIYNYDGNSYLLEYDVLGKIYNIYYIGDNHHDYNEMENGDIIFARGSGFGIYSMNGSKEKSYFDYTEVLQGFKDIYKTNRIKGAINDWDHLNTTFPIGDDVILSLRNQDMTMRVNKETFEIKWILAEDENVPDDFKKYLLKPKGDVKFATGQHSPEVISAEGGKVNLLVYDNNRTYIRGDETKSDQYSGAVEYVIDEMAMTVEEVWNYGSELGKDYFRPTHGDVDYLPDTGNKLLTYTAGEQGVEVEYSSVVEVDENNEIVFNVDIYNHENPRGKQFLYRASKMSLYPNNLNFNVYKNEAKYNNLPTTTKQSLKQFREDTKDLKKDIVHINSIGISKDKVLNINLIDNYEGTSILLENGNNKYVSGEILAAYTNYSEGNIDISTLPYGEYKVSILADNNGEKIYTPTNYYFQSVDPSLVNAKNTSIEKQESIYNSLKTTFNNGNYTLEDPLITVDPYNLSPLTALVMFETSVPTKVEITVKGKDANSTEYNSFNEYGKVHEIPVYGLYSNFNNEVIISTVDENGNSNYYTHYIQTSALPEDAYKIKVNQIDKGSVEKGFVFFESSKYFAVDNNGDYRWYLTNEFDGKNSASPIRKLKNGNIAVLSDEFTGVYYSNGIYEMDYMGRVKKFYPVEHTHHEIEEMPNGNFLVPSVNPSGRKTEEDYIVEVDRKTGEIVNTIDFYNILKTKKIADDTYLYNQFYSTAYDEKKSDEDNKAAAEALAKEDWLHINAIDYIEKDNSIIVSGRNQDIIFKMDYGTNEIKWILSDPNDDFGDQGHKLLKPVGKFEYQYGQHAPSMEGNILYFYDNGNYRSKNLKRIVAGKNNYSRGVAIKIDEKNLTFEEVWQYGKDTGFQTYTPYIGDIDKLGKEHYLINFGGLITNKDGLPSDNIYSGMSLESDTSIRVVEVIGDKVVMDIEAGSDLYSNNYRASRENMY